MSTLFNVQHEAFARARAEGLTRRDAYVRAGYTGNSDHAYKIARRPEVKARVKELFETARWGASSDLAPVIDTLMRAAQTAAELGTAAGLNAARGLLSEAAKLKRLLGAQAPRDDEYEPIPTRMSEEEWMRTYAAVD